MTGTCLLLLPIILYLATGILQAARPNILFILNDDMGYGDPEVYNEESKIPTPEMNRIASEGMRFTDAHTPYSVCTPTRYGFMTGRYAYRSPLNGGIVWEFGPPAIEEDHQTIAQMLQGAGYATALIGKWHLGMTWPTTDGSDPNRTGGELVDFSEPITKGPNDRGFDYYFGTDVPNFPPYCYIENRLTQGIPSTTKPAGMHGYNGVMCEGHDLVEILPTLMDSTINWMTNHVTSNPDKPFFLFFSNTAPHVPIAPTDEFVGTSEAHLYGDFIVQIDDMIGKFDSTLDALGISQNTLTIITSDNGSRHSDGTNMAGTVGAIVENYNHNPSGPLRGKKWDIWEGGHRVPFIAKWPGVIPEGTVTDEIISLTDMFVTFASITGTDVPATTAHDSYDIMPALLGLNLTEPIREATIAHRGGNFAIRQGDWKYIKGSDEGLYNLSDDLAEANDVAAQNPEIVQALNALISEYQNGERTAPQFVPGSDARLTEGCKDPAFSEYDAEVLIHDVTACLTSTGISLTDKMAASLVEINLIQVKILVQGRHELKIYNLQGDVIEKFAGSGLRTYNLKGNTGVGVHFLELKTSMGVVLKKITLY